jgi:hypothetical protein
MSQAINTAPGALEKGTAADSSRLPNEIGSRLVTANLHSDEGNAIACDITPGPRYRHRFKNVRPLIADFLADESDRARARSRTIAESEYRRCQELGERGLRHRQPIRFGRPLERGRPGRRSLTIMLAASAEQEGKNHDRQWQSQQECDQAPAHAAGAFD